MKLAEHEMALLAALATRPSGAVVRGDEERAALLSLCAKGLVCDPHEMGTALFTRITDKGRDALKHNGGEG